MPYLLTDPVWCSKDTKNGKRMLHRESVELVPVPVELVNDVVNKPRITKPAVGADNVCHASHKSLMLSVIPKPSLKSDCDAVATQRCALQQSQVEAGHMGIAEAQGHTNLDIISLVQHHSRPEAAAH